jgi:hypothetical protein
VAKFAPWVCILQVLLSHPCLLGELQPRTPAAGISNGLRQLVGAYAVSIQGRSVLSVEQANRALTAASGASAAGDPIEFVSVPESRSLMLLSIQGRSVLTVRQANLALTAAFDASAASDPIESVFLPESRSLMLSSIQGRSVLTVRQAKTLLSLLLSTPVPPVTPSNSFSFPSLDLTLSTFAVHPCILSCPNSSGSTLFAPFREEGFCVCVSYSRCARGRVHRHRFFRNGLSNSWGRSG